MKVVQINSTCGSGSTGKICVAISKQLSAQNIENYVLYAIGNSDYPLGIKYMSEQEVKWQALQAKVFGNYGFQSKAATKRLIKYLNAITPNVVHLHNLHSHNVHLGMLFEYLKEKNIKIFWTFHDCWAFTGYCTHYGIPQCKQWERGCQKCPLRSHYSWFFDRSGTVYNEKKVLFTELDMTIITPSQWLANQVKRSFLLKNEVRVIHNGIDLSVFQPRKNDFRDKYHVADKYVILGVAFDWGPRKGLDVFIELSKRLDDRFQIVLVGTNKHIDKQLPRKIISIHRTYNQQELAEIYTAADLFLNPTREDNFPTVNIEALACGTPVATFQTGGSPEAIDEACGNIVPYNDVDTMEKEIIRICHDRPYSPEACQKRAKNFNRTEKFREYVELYQERKEK